MNLEKLRDQLAEMRASLQEWLTRKAQAEQTLSGAQRQIDVHNGHLERIQMWIKELEQQASAEPQP